MSIVFQNEDFTVRQYCLAGLKSNMYVLHGNDCRAIIIDPFKNDQAFSSLLETGVSEIIVLLTHEHYDHISGVNRLRNIFDKVKVICTSKCADNIQNSEGNLSFFWDIIIAGLSEEDRAEAEKVRNTDYTCYADEAFYGCYEFEWSNTIVKMRSAPGHSEGGCLIYMGEQLLFTGDNLVNGNGVICRWPGGSKKDYLSITQPMIEQIPSDTLICPGHGETGYIDALKQYLIMYRK